MALTGAAQQELAGQQIVASENSGGSAPHAMEHQMKKELTSVEARSGVVSGRVLTVLVISFVGAILALAIAWFGGLH